MGGPYITNYKKPYGHEVPGLVYAEASHPDQKKSVSRPRSESRWKTQARQYLVELQMRLCCALAMSLVRHKPPVLLRLSRRQTAARQCASSLTDDTVRRDSAGATS